MKKIYLAILFSLVIVSTSILADDVIINSKEWKDVYSGMQYGFLSGKEPKFLTSERHSTLILNEIPIGDNNIEVYSSRRNPWVIGYESLLKSRDYTAEETIFESLSLELARRLTDISNYIIVDDSYGYNAIAVAPYAMVSKSFVLFTDETNTREVLSFLNSKEVNKIIIYGNVDREVLGALEPFEPEIINKDGDRFANNVEIVKKYKKDNDIRQVILTNGEFIEAEIMSGANPVLFIGIENVPDEIREYIQSSNIDVGVLIGNELVGTATTVRRQTGISTFVKFARSARNPSGTIAQVEGLDIFRLPKYELSLSIESMKYNLVTRQLEVTLRNNVELASYFKGTYTLNSGGESQVVGDIEPIFIDGGDLKTIVYDLEPIVGDDDIEARAFIVYGESKNALERTLEATLIVERIEVLDDTSITIEKLEYNKGNKRFSVYIKNTGNIDAYVDTEVVDVRIAGTRYTLGAEKIIKLSPGQTKVSLIKAELEEEDLEDNELIKVRAYYGQRADALVKIVEGEFEVIVKAFDIWTWLPIILILILIILLILAKRKKKKKKY